MRWTPLFALPAAFCAVLGGQAALSAAHGSDVPHTAGPMTIQSVSNGRLVDLDRGHVATGQKIQEWTYNTSKAQQWWLHGAGGSYKIKSNVNGAYCLARRQDGELARVELRPCEDRLADWVFQGLGGQRYRIADPTGRYHLRVRDTNPANGRELVVGAGAGTGADWYLTDLRLPRRPMPADPRLDQVTFLTAHNAMANTDEGFWGRFPNQSYRLRSQLDQGVRGLQIDITWHRDDVRMCHGRCWGNERSLTAGLQDVADFLAADRGAVVTVFLEDYTTVDQLRGAVARVRGLAERVFRPDQAGVRERGWPTVSELVASDRRLLLFSQRPGRDGFGVMYDRDWTVENHWTMGAGGDVDCYSRWGEVPLSREEPGFRRLHTMNHYRDIPTEWAAGADNGTKLRDRVELYCAPSARSKPNYVALDFYQKPEGGAVANLIRDMNTYW
jgi:hypothetical protein